MPGIGIDLIRPRERTAVIRLRLLWGIQIGSGVLVPGIVSDADFSFLIEPRFPEPRFGIVIELQKAFTPARRSHQH